MGVGGTGKTPRPPPPSLVGLELDFGPGVPYAPSVSWFLCLLVSWCLCEGCAVPKMEERINLRLPTEVYAPYERLAQLLTGLGQPTTATQLVRTLVAGNVEQTTLLCASAAAALRGDQAAHDAVMDALHASQQAQLAAARAAVDAERRGTLAAVAVSQE